MSPMDNKFCILVHIYPIYFWVRTTACINTICLLVCLYRASHASDHRRYAPTEPSSTPTTEPHSSHTRSNQLFSCPASIACAARRVGLIALLAPNESSLITAYVPLPLHSCLACSISQHVHQHYIDMVIKLLRSLTCYTANLNHVISRP